jgi:serine/threonine-protein kinase
MPIQPAPNVVIAERFRLSRLLGRGGMGSVWYATHLGLDVPCAVKFIEGEGAQLPDVQARFEREAKAAAHLRSPHVVQILDHGVWQGTPYIAMELLDGEDVGKRLARLGRLPPRELLAIVTQVCRALTKAHSQGIVHRDLKPDNIFLVRDDDREIAKVLDFGIAKTTGAGSTGSNTRTGAMLGTPYYMSPEQAQGTKAVDARSDLWSLAVIVFEAFTGRRPFESEALGDLLMKIILGPVPVPSHVVADAPPAIDAWWARASQRDPAQRFQSAREFCDALTLALGHSASDIGHPTPPPMTSRMGALSSTTDAYAPPPSAGASTAAPIAQTFGAAPVRGRGRTAMIVAIGGGLVALSAGVVGASFALRSKGEATAVGPTATASTVPVAAALPPEPPAKTGAPASPVDAGASVTEPVTPPPSIQSAPAPRPLPAFKSAVVKPPSPAKPIASPPALPQAPPTPEKKKAIDLGI